MSDRLRVVLAEILGLEILQPAVHVLATVLADDIVVDEHRGFRSHGQGNRIAGPGVDRVLRILIREMDLGVVGVVLEIGDHQDRKSTRLNSSHGYISYAVFCLKKKKKTKRYHMNELLNRTDMC